MNMTACVNVDYRIEIDKKELRSILLKHWGFDSFDEKRHRVLVTRNLDNNLFTKVWIRDQDAEVPLKKYMMTRSQMEDVVAAAFPNLVGNQRRITAIVRYQQMRGAAIEWTEKGEPSTLDVTKIPLLSALTK
jgi:hypothetical protein